MKENCIEFLDIKRFDVDSIYMKCYNEYIELNNIRER